MTLSRKIVIILFTIIFLSVTALATAQTTPADKKSPPKANELADVMDRLIKDGFNKEKINALFSKEEVHFTTKGVSIFFSHFESAPNYTQFLKKDSIKKAAKYAAEHQETLDRAEKVYGVDKTVITAILLVETRLGTYLGRHTTINMLASIASLNDETLRQRVSDAIPKKSKLKESKFLSKVKRKSEWGYKELKAFLKYTTRENIAPETVKGSFAGAIGICQFMPSNALAIARDGNNDGKVDLFTHDDAIFSIANYLKRNGWKKGLSRQQQYDVIYTYNHSNYYVDTVQKVSDKLKEK